VYADPDPNPDLNLALNSAKFPYKNLMFSEKKVKIYKRPGLKYAFIH
jgi:hypothetical protein